MASEKICEKNGYWLMFVQAKLLKGVERGFFIAMEEKRAKPFLALEKPTVLDFSEKDTVSYLVNDDIAKAKISAIEYFQKYFFIQRAMPLRVSP